MSETKEIEDPSGPERQRELLHPVRVLVEEIAEISRRRMSCGQFKKHQCENSIAGVTQIGSADIVGMLSSAQTETPAESGRDVVR